MKSLKRVLALAVVFAMVLGSLPAMAATFSDVAEADQEAVSVLTQLNIIQGYNEDGKWLFKGDQTITRAEFAAVVDRMIGMEEVSKTQTSTIFSDVPATHWASGYITTAVNQGIIVGMGDGTFDPEAPVTYEQAIKMIACAMGYEPMAAEQGGYPTGYLFVGQTIGLLNGVSGRVGEDASRSVVANLCYNALDIPLMQKITFGTSSKQYGIYDGSEFTPRKTLMSEYLNVVKLAGTVVANENSDGNANKKGIVTIEISDHYDSKYVDTFKKYEIGATTDFKVGETNAKDFIGHNVIFFVKHESNRTIDPTIISIADNTSTNKKLAVALENLKSAELKSANTVLVEYYTDKENGKTSKLYIPAGAIKAYINGISTNYEGEDLITDLSTFNTQTGTIEFVSLETSGTVDYDTIFITVYRNFLVDSVDENSQKIYAHTDSPFLAVSTISFDPDDDDVSTTIVDEDGNKVDPMDLQKYDVLSIKCNFPFGTPRDVTTEIYECTLVRKTVEGTLTEVDDKSAQAKYYIDGKEYKVDNEASLKLQIGDTGVFYLDILGRIVAYDVTGTQKSNYAVYLNNESTSLSGYKVKLYTAEGNVIVKELASKVKWLTGNTVATLKAENKDAKDVANLLNSYAGKVCTYKENSSGKIYSLIFSTPALASSDANGWVAYNSDAIRKNYLVTNVNESDNATLLVENSDQARLRVDTTAGTKTLQLSERVKVVVATSDDWANNTDSDFEIWDVSKIKDNQYITGQKVSVYDIDDDGEAQFVFINGNVTLENATTGVALVRSTSEATNSEGAEVTKFRIISNTDDAVTDSSNNVKEFILAEENNVSGTVTVGSIVMADSRNALNEVKKLSVLTEWDADAEKFVKTSDLEAKNTSNSDVTYYFGPIVDKSSSTIYFENELNNNSEETRKIGPSTKVMIYDERRTGSSRVYEGTIAEVQYDKNGDISAKNVSAYSIFIREYKGNIEDVVLYIYE